ncbi:Acetylxylan esterase precursor [Planctomycetes bacterium MalM25]|nr:Acetylxylan esterase precursor [Planctomycetes bacterium MalM25]
MSEPIRIACVGASITFGRGLPNRRQECYPAVLQRLLDGSAGEGVCQVRNFGYSGATISRGSNEPYWETPSFLSAERFRPQITLIMLGTNDAQFANEAARARLETDLKDLIGHYRGLGAKVLVADPPPVFPPVAEIDFHALASVVRPAIRRVAAEWGVPAVDFLTPLAGDQEAFPDGLHPTAAVAERIARLAHAVIEPLLDEVVTLS